jgi:hypothetical protein
MVVMDVFTRRIIGFGGMPSPDRTTTHKFHIPGTRTNRVARAVDAIINGCARRIGITSASERSKPLHQPFRNAAT